jgi:imidazolonepropionase-like amidohydrolase
MKRAAAHLLLAGWLLTGGCSLEPSLPRLIKLAPARPELRIENVALFDAENARIVTDQTLVVKGGVVAWVGGATAATLPAPATDAVRIDGRGKTLLPGLVDAHVHLGIAGAPPWQMRMANPRRNLEAMLLAGVTTVFEPGGFIDVSRALRQGVRDGSIDGPDIYTAGPVFAARGGHPFPMVKLQVPSMLVAMIAPRLAYLADDTADLPGLLARFDASGADFMKLIVDELPFGAPVLGDAIIARAVRHAHKRGLKVFAHVGSASDAMRSARAGVDVLAHTPYDDLLSAAEIAELKRRGVAVMSTLQIWANTVALATAHEGLVLRHMAKQVFDPAVAQVLEQPRPAGWAPPDSFAPWLAFITSDQKFQVANFLALYQAGVTVVVATDSPNLGMAPGDALHVELEAVVAAGVPAGEALRAASLTPARRLGLDGQLGSLAAGKRADLLLLDGDPTLDIRNLDRISAVYSRGRRVTLLSAETQP